VATRFLHGGQPSLEAQLCNLADEVAYNAHDIDDGVRSGLIELEQLESAVPLVHQHMGDALAAHPKLSSKRLLCETIRRMLSAQVYDIIDATREALAEAAPPDAAAVRAGPPLLRFSPAMRAASTELKRFLFANLYRHQQVHDTRKRAEEVLRDLFACYMADPALLPTERRSDLDIPRACADYIAGMTDRFALKEHQRLTGKQLF
ncbi:MAG TPA: deoxyguanosinetriphosphate triphosphohydrolase, partial [Burkholderiaceae bacterium]